MFYIQNGFNGNFIGADIKETGFQSELYDDAVVCKDVIDHMKKSDAKLATSTIHVEMVCQLSLK